MNTKEVEKSVEWFNKNHESMKKMNEIFIKDAFENAGFSGDDVTSHTNLVYKAAKLVENDSVWDRKLYINKNGCAIAFYNNDCHIDCYGNYFKNEDDFLKIMSRFTLQLNFRSHDGMEYNLENFPTDSEIIQIVTDALSRHERDKAFSSFNDDCDSSEVVEILQKIKAYFLFFYALDEKITKCDKLATFKVTEDEFHIVFSNLRYFVISFKSFKVCYYEKEVQAVNLDGDMKNIPYEELKIHLPFKNGSDNANFQILQSQTEERFRLKIFAYRNYCHFIAIKMHKYMLLKQNQSILCTKITEFKSMVFWVDAKFIAHNKAKKEFEKNETKIKEEYCELLNLIADPNNRSAVHEFSQPFTALYHYQKHYAAIADILRNDCNLSALEYPKPTSSNRKECLTAYLKTIADAMFDNGDFEFQQDINPSTFKTEQRQNYCFLKYGGLIKGLKYKFMNPSQIKTGTGRLPMNKADLEGAYISTISQNN